jgi:hypothetical protein
MAFSACTFVLVGASIYLTWDALLGDPPPSPPQRLGNSQLTISLTGVRTGTKAEFLHGTSSEKSRDLFLPSDGVNILGRKLSPAGKVVRFPASGRRRLFLEFQIRGAPNTVYSSGATSPGSGRKIMEGPGFSHVNYMLFGTVQPKTTSAPSGSPSPFLDASSASNILDAAQSFDFNTGKLSLERRGTRMEPTITYMSAPMGSMPVGSLSKAPIAFPGQTWVLIPDGEHRMVLIGDDGFEYLEPFWPRSGVYSNGYFYLQPGCFPRQSRNLTVRIERRENNYSEWRTVATFQTRVQPESMHRWTAGPTPNRKSHGGVACLIGEVSSMETTLASDCAYEARMPFQLLQNNVPQTDWDLISLDAEDTGGNFVSCSPFCTTNAGWLLVQTPQDLNPNLVWRVQTTFKCNGGSADTNTYPFEFFVQPVNKIGKK